jgi:hypothetical protein
LNTSLPGRDGGRRAAPEAANGRQEA